MVSMCFYFQVHQPYRLKDFSVFDIGKNKSYYNKKKNEEILKKVAKKCYIPTNNLIMQTIHNNPEFKASYSLSGVFLDQIEEYYPELIESFKNLVKTKNIEMIDETYHHSLSFLYSKEEFKQQVRLHNKKIKKLFGYSPKVFRNTELIYNNDIAKEISKMGYKGIIAEGADHVLKEKSPNFLYKPPNTKIALLLKNYKLSDDIAFRFSNNKWNEWPLTSQKFSSWVNKANGNGNLINLFMDYETFGEHQWASTGIFNFIKSLPKEILKHPDNNFMTPSEVIDNYKPVEKLDVSRTTSWADQERDTSAWIGNNMQKSAIEKIYKMETMVKSIKDKSILSDWRRLQTSDHFYYMCTKWFNDGDVHKYFNPYESPYESFINYMNIIHDIELKIKSKLNNNTKEAMTNIIQATTSKQQ